MAQGLATQMALCHRHTPSCHRQALQQQRGQGAWQTPRTGHGCARPAARHLTVTAVAAVEDAPSTSAATPDEEEFVNAMDFTNTEDLYARFNQLLEQGALDFKEGDKVTGVIATVDQRGAYVEIGGKMPAYCPLDELSLVKLSRASKVLAPDTVREFVITSFDRRTGEVQLSIKSIEQALLWQRLRQLRDYKVYYPAVVESANRSGVLATVHGLSGFIPGSHIPNDVDMETLPGQELMCTFLEVDEEGQRLVMSARRRIDKNALGVKVGDVVLGTVQAVQAYGAFVELGKGQTGLLHVSQISHDRITQVDKVLSVGDKLKVMILTYDKDRGRISLSTKKLEPSPGDMLRNPQLVFQKADEMAAAFKEQFAQAEAASRVDLSGNGFPPAAP